VSPETAAAMQRSPDGIGEADDHAVASCRGVREPRLHDRPRPGLRRAELVAFGVLHDPPVPGRSLVDLADAGCPQLFQPGHQLVEAAGLTVYVDVQAVLAGLAAAQKSARAGAFVLSMTSFQLNAM
jgi:hypothetical protein